MGTIETAERVARNVAALRADRRLTVRGLSERLSELGHPLLPSAITKIEKGGRRVDVEDLVALAIALDVTPARLLLPPQAGEQEVQLTPQAHASARAAWEWACGVSPLSDPWDDRPPVTFDLDRFRRFREENRPHEPDTSLEVIMRNEDALAAAAKAVLAATSDELPMATVLSYVQLAEKTRELNQQLRARFAGPDHQVEEDTDDGAR